MEGVNTSNNWQNSINKQRNKASNPDENIQQNNLEIKSSIPSENIHSNIASSSINNYDLAEETYNKILSQKLSHPPDTELGDEINIFTRSLSRNPDNLKILHLVFNKNNFDFNEQDLLKAVIKKINLSLEKNKRAAVDINNKKLFIEGTFDSNNTYTNLSVEALKNLNNESEKTTSLVLFRGYENCIDRSIENGKHSDWSIMHSIDQTLINSTIGSSTDHPEISSKDLSNGKKLMILNLVLPGKGENSFRNAMKDCIQSDFSTTFVLS